MLAAWRWLVRMPKREALIADEGPDESSARCLSLEGPCDLAYRGVLPAALGRALRRAPTAEPMGSVEVVTANIEEYATARDSGLVDQEAAARKALWQVHG